MFGKYRLVIVAPTRKGWKSWPSSEELLERTHDIGIPWRIHLAVIMKQDDFPSNSIESELPGQMRWRILFAEVEKYSW